MRRNTKPHSDRNSGFGELLCQASWERRERRSAKSPHYHLDGSLNKLSTKPARAFQSVNSRSRAVHAAPPRFITTLTI